jgi:carbon-monoxide dehydrogenase large subunit
MIGQALERREDLRFLTGRACYVDDVKRPGMLHAAVVRSAMAHAQIRAIDTVAAKALKGVAAVVTAEDMGRARHVPLWITPLPGFERFLQPIIARERVRFVGEPLAIVIAEDRYIAEDAADLVTVEYEPLDAVVDVEGARTDKTLLHPDKGTNVASHYTIGRGDAKGAFERAAYRRKERLKVHRHSAVPLETRGLVAEWDEANQRMRVWGAAKLPFRNRSILAGMLELPEAQIELLEMDIGGGFGVRGEFYPEDFLVPWAARRLGRPVKWIEDRREHLMATNHSRQMECELEIAVDKAGIITALRGRLFVDMGAYIRPNGGVGPGKVPQFICGPYRIGNAEFEFNALLTNKTPFGSYRGPGRYECNYFRERLMDIAAADLGLDPVDFRLRNMIRPQDMPWDAGSLVPGLPPTIFDKADYPEVMSRALRAFDYASRKTQRSDDGRLYGVGVGCFVESTGGGPSESARIRIRAPDRIELCVGTSSMGQGHETTLAQVLADELGVGMARISVSHGSTNIVSKGWGTYHSRGAVMAGSAITLAAAMIREQVAERAGGYDAARLRAVTAEETLEAEAIYSSNELTYTFGVQLAHVAVDPKTAKVEVLHFLAVEDVGRIINPAVVHGQAIGAAVQGLGGTMLDEFVYDESGQLLTGSFADYLLPTSTDFPNVDALSLELSPSLSNPLGAKGAAEGGIAATGAALSNAVADALRPLGVTLTDLPLSPNNLARAIRQAQSKEIHR